MPSSPLNLTRIRRNILTYSSFSVFCVAMITALVLAYPSFVNQRDYTHGSLKHAVQLEALSVGEYIRRLEEISLQIAGRTTARNILGEFNRQVIDAPGARAALLPILSDALGQADEVVGIQRLDARNNFLLAVGESVDPLFWPPVPSLEEGLTMTGPIAVGGQWRLVIRALIRAPGEREPLGTDIVTFSSQRLAAILGQRLDGEADGQAILAAMVNGEWRFLQGQPSGPLIDLTARQLPQLRGLFRERVADANTPILYHENEGFGLAAAAVPGTDWRVLVQNTTKSLHAEMYSSLQLSLVVAVVLAAAGAVITLIVIRPLSGMMAEQTATLENHVKEKTRDLTDLTAELDKARRLAEEASQAKSRFLATTSHELRTPLNAILGYAELIRDRAAAQDPDRMAYYGQQIYEASDHLLTMINGLLDFSKVEAGKVKLSPEILPLRDVLGQSMRTVEPMAQRRSIRLSMEICPDLRVMHADREALRQMVTNLLSNAVKFTRPGGYVRLSAEQKEEGSVVIAVTDTGVGMTEEQIRTALQPFEQVDNALSREYPGTGLGLALVNGLVELHGGRLEIVSEPGVGTTALLSFPQSQAMAA